MDFYDYEQNGFRRYMEREFQDMLQMEKDNSTELRQLKLRQYQNRFFIISKYKEVFSQYMPFIGDKMWVSTLEDANKFLSDKTIDKRKNTPEKQGMTMLRSLFSVRFGFTNPAIQTITCMCGFGIDVGVTSYDVYFTCEDVPDEKLFIKIPIITRMDPDRLLKMEMPNDEFKYLLARFGLSVSVIEEQTDHSMKTATLIDFPTDLIEDKDICKTAKERLGLHRVPIKDKEDVPHGCREG